MCSKLSNSSRIAIVWEQNEWGGVDSYLEYLLNSWPNKQDQIVVLHNKGNKGAIRLMNLLSNNDMVSFVQINTVFKYYPWSNFFANLLKIIIHVLTPVLFIYSVSRYKQLFNSEKFDIVIGQNGGYPGSYGVLSSLIAAKKAGVKVRSLVVHHAAGKPIIMHGWFRMIIERKLGGGILTSVIAVSHATKDTLVRNTYLFDQQKCHVTVIENGIPIPDKRIKKTNNPHDKFKIGMLGRLEPYKGHDDFLCALSILSQSCLEKIKVEFFGGYADSDYKRLTNIINKLELENTVDILGYVDSNVTDIIAGLDLVVMVTKTFEGFGLTVIEALHQGVPVLATNVGVVQELFPEGSEFIVDVGDFDGMAKLIEKIVLSNEKERWRSS